MRRRRGSIRPTVRAAGTASTLRQYDQVLRAERFTGRQCYAQRREAISLLLCDHVIQTKNHHRIGVAKDLVVQWQALTRLVNPLVNYDWMSRGLTDDVLKPHGRQVK